jgi:Transglycosylase-like domain
MQLSFGKRARRRARLRRWTSVAWVLSMGAALAGIPGANLGVDTVERLAGRPARRGMEATESTNSLLSFRRGVFESRPTPVKPQGDPPAARSAGDGRSEGAEDGDSLATPSESVDGGGSITDIISSAAAAHGLSGAYLLSVAECESGLDPNAVNAAGYHGLFQFDQQTWAAYGYGSIYDPAAQADTAAELIAGGEAERWPNCA